jgi:hypothetical protein
MPFYFELVNRYNPEENIIGTYNYSSEETARRVAILMMIKLGLSVYTIHNITQC